jgi:hypothetical protein
MRHALSYPALATLLGTLALGSPRAMAQYQYVQRPLTGQVVPVVEQVGSTAPSLSGATLRRIDHMAVQLVDSARELSLEVSEHFRNERHSQKLAEDTRRLIEVAEALHRDLHESQYGYVDAAKLRESANEFIEVVARLPRTIGLLERQPKSFNARQGIPHMYSAYRQAHIIAMEIDRYLPVDTEIVDRQADRLTKAVEELHLEFHEHFESYQLSARIEAELTALTSTAEHIHEIAHRQAWSQWQLAHIARDVQNLREQTRRVESLINLQAQRGIRSADWDGVEHSLDAVTDIHAAAYLLEHMVAKFQRSSPPVAGPVYVPVETRRPVRDQPRPIAGSGIYDHLH